MEDCEFDGVEYSCVHRRNNSAPWQTTTLPAKALRRTTEARTAMKTVSAANCKTQPSNPAYKCEDGTQECVQMGGTYICALKGNWGAQCAVDLNGDGLVSDAERNHRCKLMEDCEYGAYGKEEYSCVEKSRRMIARTSAELDLFIRSAALDAKIAAAAAVEEPSNF
jgi:hypothetical protein